MAAEKKGKSTIVIKKIYVTAGHHGGAWKVAFADFMTAMMAFFMVMWLLGQNDETKKAVSDHFSTPSIVEYNFRNYGAIITLEKLFLDFVNAPLQAIHSFLEPIDKTPNVLDFGSAAIAGAFLADHLSELTETPQNLKLEEDGLIFRIIDDKFFDKGTANISPNFIANTDKIRAVTNGLEDATLSIQVNLFNESVTDSNPAYAKEVAMERLGLLINKIKAGFENPSIEVNGTINVVPKADYQEGMSRPNGFVQFEVRQKEIREDGTKYRKLERAFKSGKESGDVYQNFINKITEPTTR